MPETLLARNERVAVMQIFHLTLLKIVRKANIVMGGQKEARVFALKPAANGFDFFRRRLLLGSKVVKAEHHESVSVGQYPFVDRQSITRLIDALEDRDGMAGDILGNLLEAERRPVKQFQRASDSL